MIELLYFDACPNHEAFLPHLRELLAQAGTDAEVQLRSVESPEAAERERFLGSPTLRVDGGDVEPGASERDDFGLKCRLYRTDDGLVGVPPDEWVLAALQHGQTRAAGPITESRTKVGAALLALGIAPESSPRSPPSREQAAARRRFDHDSCGCKGPI